MPILKFPSHHHDQLAYLTEAMPGAEAKPSFWREMDVDVSWSCTRARNRRFNNRAPLAPAEITDIRAWSSGYWSGVAISPVHVVCCAHYRRFVPSQIDDLRFMGRFGVEHKAVVKALHEDVGDDLDLIELETPLPGDVFVCSRIADLRTAKRGTPVLLQTSQMQTVMMTIDAVGTIVETGGAAFAHTMKLVQVTNGTDDLVDALGSPYFFAGDSGSPVMGLDQDGAQCFVGFAAGGGPIAVGGTKWPGNEFETLRGHVESRGYQLHAVNLGSRSMRFSADADGDGDIDAADAAIVLANWSLAGCGDVNRDGVVDAMDLAEVLAGWKA